ncbi:outer membrane lipoprotein carrier protein LolA [Metabacillus herbersteinensis]|uniref:Outer membrane lipoprotein carrier protein LolA n=1 Tax=Metabacillus herbersteinensis TaxID=283816 RepID=A0ABV6GMV7_9BACI
MRKSFLFLVVGLFAVLLLAGCGEKSQADVVKGLNKKVTEMTGYKAEAKMTLQTGSEPQVYDVEIWYKDPTYYRVNLKNAQKDQSQMILRNDEGVFVLTPALNKSFRFQSDWPQNSSQAYLYESLVKDILKDSAAKFKATEGKYVFETKTNYQNNKMLPSQEITFNNDMSPSIVKVLDTDRNPLVVVEFSKFEFNSSFDKNAFDVEKNMSHAQIEVPTLAMGNREPFAVKYPLEQPAGVELVEEKEIETENGKRVILSFEGEEKSFTLIQESAEIATPASASTSTYVSGDPADLGFTVGALTETSLTWTHEGVDYMLASEDLSEEEMLMVAKSIQGQSAK